MTPGLSLLLTNRAKCPGVVRRSWLTRIRPEFAAIRNILTADQRVTFDKNVAELKQRGQERAGRVGDRGQRGKGFRGQKKGQGNQG